MNSNEWLHVLMLKLRKLANCVSLFFLVATVPFQNVWISEEAQIQTLQQDWRHAQGRKWERSFMYCNVPFKHIKRQQNFDASNLPFPSKLDKKIPYLQHLVPARSGWAKTLDSLDFGCHTTCLLTSEWESTHMHTLCTSTGIYHNAQQVHPASPYLVSQGAAGEVKGGKPTCAMIAMEGPRTPGRFNANELPHGLGEVWRSPDMRHTMAHLKFTYFATHPAVETTKGQGKAIRTDTTAFGFISFQYVQSQSDFQDLAGWEELELSFWHALYNLTDEKQFLNVFQMNLNDRNTVIPIQESVCSKKLALALRPVDCPYAGSSSTLFVFTLQSCGAPFCSGKAMRKVRSAFLKSSEFFRYTMIHLHYRYIIVAVSALSVLIW